MPIFDDPRTQGGMGKIMQLATKKPKLPADPPMAPMLGGQVGDPPPAPMITTTGTGASPAQNWMSSKDQGVQAAPTGSPPQFAGWSKFGSNPAGPPAPQPGHARAWSSQGPSTPSTPVQNFSVPVGPQPNHGRMPDQIGHSRVGFGGGAGDTGSFGGGGTTAAANISSFYDSIGLPLSDAIGGAQRDEALAQHEWASRNAEEGTTRRLQQLGMAHNLQAGPENELVKRISELSTANLYNPTPEGTALIQHYMQQLQQRSPAVAGSGHQQEASTPATTPTPNEHPGVGGMLHAALHRGLPAAAGAGGWAAGAALAPETGALSLLVPAVASALSYFGGNQLMDKVDPGGVGAAEEHPVASVAGQFAGGIAGYKGFGRFGAKTAGSGEGSLSQKNVGANTGGPAGTIGAEAAGTATTTRPYMGEYERPPGRQMSPFGGGEVQPGQTPVAPASRQLGMGSMGAQASASQNTQTAGTPSPTTQQAEPFKVQMSGDPQIDEALARFKQNLTPTMPQGEASNILPFPPQAQQTQASPPGMRSTAMPTPRVESMRVSQPAERQRVGTNPVQMPQPPSSVTTLNPALLDPSVLQRIIGDPRIGPAISHDPAFQALIQRYINAPEL